MTKALKALAMVLAIGLLTGCAASRKMTNVVLVKPTEDDADKTVKTAGKKEMLILPHQGLGLEPTEAICRGDTTTFLAVFPRILLMGELFPGRLRWNAWVVKDDGTEAFGQIMFAGIHKSGEFFGAVVVDGQVESGLLVLLSTTVDFIYSPFMNELAVDRIRFLKDPTYRRHMITEVNKDKNGEVFNLARLARSKDFQGVVRKWNQIQFPEGYLLSPYGEEEVALIRGVNPQYSFFQKLIGTGKFQLKFSPNPLGMAISNAAGLAVDVIRAFKAPSKGGDFNSEISRRQMGFIGEYLLKMEQLEIAKRNAANAELLKELNSRSD